MLLYTHNTLGGIVMIGINDNKLYSNILVFKFSNFDLDYSKEISEVMRFSTNRGEFKELETINTLGMCSYKKLFVVGLGATEEFSQIKLFRALGTAIGAIKNTIDDLDILDNLPEDLGYTLGQSIQISVYKYAGIKKEHEKIKLQNINVISKYKESINKGVILGNCINFSRQLVNMPSNIVTPKYLTQQAENISTDEELDIDIIDKYRLKQMGMNSILAVCSGSSHNPRLIVLQYFGNPDNKEIVSLIGKGVTFDSGGLSLKPSKGMEAMVGDMAGASYVLGIMKAVGRIRPKKNIIALIPVVENMPSGNSYRPGDIITTYSGKTVEVISTDAEGRLILCDAITYAKELGATKIIDIATLTGSCANFLGGINIGLFSNSDSLSSSIIKAGNAVGENFWRLPNNIEYFEQLKTDKADLKNTGTNSGAVVAGMFLESFSDGVDFAHLDIAGCSSYSKPYHGYDIGANGITIRTIVEYLLK